MSAAERHEAVNEIRVLASVKNQHIVSYHEAFIDGNRLCIVMEYAQQGDLSKMIRKRHKENRPMDEDLIWSYFIQLVRGLASLHANRVLHRDMKAANVLRVSPTVPPHPPPDHPPSGPLAQASPAYRLREARVAAWCRVLRMLGAGC
mmetsp:Transcript_57277/g.181199  ORF Transcript_57277/g.181199 Transcript_57277/m.181199 type:complete len:147 (+) Transcript_57277:464-904(+)